MEQQKVGTILKSEREKKGMSLHEVGMSLKINPKILKAIEDNDHTQLPAKTFLRGFVRSYAQFLRLDVQEILNLLQIEISPATAPTAEKEVQTDSPKVEVAKKEEAPKAKPLDEPSGMSGKKIFRLLGTGLLIVLIIIVAKTVDKYQKESATPKVEIDEAQKLATVGNATTPEINSSQVGANLTTGTITNNEPVNGATAPLPGLTPSPTPTVSPTPTPTPVSSATTTATVVSAATASPAPSTQTPTPTPVAKAYEIIIEALNAVEIKYSFGDDKAQTVTLAADEMYTFKSKTGITLHISDGGSINLIVNGRERGVPGTIGKPIKLSYPK
jgi:cytoskeleton protein RodZ